MKRIGIILLILVASALITQGFQCASREMTTAKVKMKDKDWPAVRQALEAELVKNPSNDEAKVMLAEVLDKLGKVPELVAFLKKNEPLIIDPIEKERIQKFTVNYWSESLFNKSTKYYGKYDKDKNKAYLDTAIVLMKYFYDLRPEIAPISYTLADYYRLKGDDAKMIEYYNLYFEALKPDLDFAAQKGFYLNSPRTEIIKILGKPASSVGTRSTRTDSSYIDIFKVDGKDVVFQSTSNKEHPAQIIGWRTVTRPYWHPKEKELLLQISLEPYNTLIQQYLNKNDYNSAFSLAKQVLAISPDNKKINALIIELYQKLNKIDEAISTLNEQIAKEPKNSFAYAQLGDIYRITENYDKSIEAYKKAIEIDPKFTAAILNLATSYKNKAGVIQAKQIQESEKDPKFQFKPQEYEPFLIESGKYYSKVLENPTFENNLDVYKELINIYLVLNDKENLAKAVAKVEGLESQAKDKEQYYLDMMKIYGSMKDNAKRDAMKAKFDAIAK